MKSTALTITLIMPLCSFTLFAQEFDQGKATDEAKAAVKAFGGALKSELVAAMKNGSPTNALGVCNIEAMSITAHISKEQDAIISRVSLKNRNPENAPTDWQKAILEEFDNRAADGEDIAPMASVSVVEQNGKKQLRLMKAVPTEGVCLACHGQEISPDVQAKLDELYPQDKATGYSAGEVRGAIVVVKEY